MKKPTADNHKNPFPGLRPFREDEEYLFFGRENQVDAMVDKLAATRFLAVVGTSGSGKSSLVNCGLRPALHGGLMARAGTAWRMAQFRPGSNPMRAMARALAEDGVLFRDYQAGGLTLAEIVDTTLRMSKLGLIDIFEQAQLGEDVNLLVVVDQFEEMFRYRQFGAGHQENVYGISEEAAAFVNLLLEAKAQTTYPIYVVLTMRSDFLGDCTQFTGLAEAINAGQYLVPRMTRDERRAAISGPVGVGGAEISPVLLTRLVNDVGDNPDQLSILQHALNRTWNQRERSGDNGPLALPHYEAIGTMAQALDQHAERAYAELSTVRQQQICEKLFKALTDKATDPRGVRRPTTLGTLCGLADATPAEVTQVIDVFRKPSRSFLMPPAEETLQAETVIDISHESLMRVWERLKTWADQEAQSAHIYSRLAETAVLHGEGKAGLWNDPDLQVALDWQEKNQPNKEWARRYDPGFEGAIAFLQASEKKRTEDGAERERQQNAEIERARRELQQAEALAEAQQERADAQRQKAEEQQQRLEQQARAASRLRRLLAAFGVVALLALASTVFAFSLYQKAGAATRKAEAASKVAEDEKSKAVREKENAVKANGEAVIASNKAEDEKSKALRETDKAKKAAREAETQKQIAETEKKKADVLSEGFQSQALNGEALRALQAGDTKTAIEKFNAYLDRCKKMKDPSCRPYALENIADIYMGRLPFALLEINFTEDPAPPDEGDMKALYAATMKQYAQIFSMGMYLEGEGKDKKALYKKLSTDGKEAVVRYELALNAIKGSKNAAQPLKEADILKNLGDLQIFLALANAKLAEETDQKEVEKETLREMERGIQREMERGIQYYLEARAVYVKAQRPLEEAGVLTRAADLLEQMGSKPSASDASDQTQAADKREVAAEIERRVGFFEEASDAFRRAKEPLMEASALIRVGQIYKEFPKEDPEGQRKAILYFERALQIFRNEKSFKKEGDLIRKLVDLYVSDESKQIALYKEAFEAYNRVALEPTKQDDDPRNATEMLTKAGNLLYKSSGKDEAEKFFKEAITAGRNDSVSKARIFTTIGDFYIQNQDTAEALKYYGLKRDMWRQVPNPFEEGSTLVEIGSIQSASENVAGAIEAFDAARQVYKQIDAQAVDETGKLLRSAVTGNLMKMAADYAKQDKQKAIAAYEEALQSEMLVQKSNSNYTILQIVAAEGRILLEMKTNEGNMKAEQLFRKVIEFSRSPKSTDGETGALFAIGDLYQAVGQPAEARAYYERVRVISLTTRDTSKLYDTLRRIGGLEEKGNPAKPPLDYYLGEAESAGQAHDSFTQGAALEMAGQLYRYTEKQKAIDYYERARLAYQGGGLKPQEIAVTKTLMNIYQEIGNKRKSDELEKRVNELSRTPK